MNLYVEQLNAALTGRYVIQTERTDDGFSIFCRDLEGNLITTRVFTAQQLRNTSLVRLAMSDLKNTLLASSAQPEITPLPETLHPSAS